MYENLQRKYEDQTDKKSKIDPDDDLQSRNASMEFSASERSFIDDVIEY